MQNKYWVQYVHGEENYTISEFVTTGDGEEFKDLEAWWLTESAGSVPHEILQVVKL